MHHTNMHVMNVRALCHLATVRDPCTSEQATVDLELASFVVSTQRSSLSPHTLPRHHVGSSVYRYCSQVTHVMLRQAQNDVRANHYFLNFPDFSYPLNTHAERVSDRWAFYGSPSIVTRTLSCP